MLRRNNLCHLRKRKNYLKCLQENARWLIPSKHVYKTDYGSIQSIMSGEVVGGGEFVSKVERLAERVLLEEEKFVKALDEYFAIEDRLAEAIGDLSPEENEVIVEFYMQGYSERKIARIMNYSESTVKRRRVQAIRKISKKI